MELRLEYAIPGFILGALFIICLCNPCGRGVDYLQRGEELCRQKCGRKESLCLKWCMICVLMPLYFITIWMGVVAFGGNVGLDIINQVCGSDVECRLFFAFGLYKHDKEACQEYNCTDSQLFARSGSSHLDFVPNLGLGKDQNPNRYSADYICLETSGNLCVKASSSASSTYITSPSPRFCSSDCDEWTFDIDTTVSFALGKCDCSDGNGTVCSTWTCDEVVMPYFYPNVFFSLLVAVLFILPMIFVMGYVAKAQLGKKFLPCGDPEIVVFDQAGGVMSTKASNLASGGHTQDITRDRHFGVKSRSFSRYDCALFVVGTTVISVLTYLMWVASGFISIVLLCLCIVANLCFLLYYYIFCFLKPQQERINEVKQRYGA